MPTLTRPIISPAKPPKQRRSTVTVDAILQATIQVLRRDGKARLTTTRIAARAGVSVGTLYQYFPNKTALLQEALRRHLDRIADAMETACARVHGEPLSVMADTIAHAWTYVKFHNLDASIALYSVSDDIEGRTIAKTLRTRVTGTMAAAFRTAPDSTIGQPELVAGTLLGALSGISRDLLETTATAPDRLRIGRELNQLVRAYLTANPGGVPGDQPQTPSTPSSL